MKRLLQFTLILYSFSAFAQFNINGEIKGYNNQSVHIKINENGQKRLLKRIQTNDSGEFSYQVPMQYTGTILLELNQGGIELVADNNDIAFTTNLSDGKQKISHILGVNSELEDYHKVQQMYEIRDNTLMALLNFYDTNTVFYSNLLDEISRINNTSLPVIDNPKINYYLTTKDELSNLSIGNLPAEQAAEKAKNHLVNDGEDLERFGLLNDFVSHYISNSIGTAKSREEAIEKIDLAVEKLLDDVVIDTPRGQNILSTVIPMLEGNGFDSLATKYVAKAEEMKCEMTDNLRNILEAKSQIQVGKKAPNFKMTGAKYKSLYDIKADQKLLVFWASWCPHCMKEMPFVNEFYNEFKDNGGEIVAISLDMDKNQYENTVKEFNFINYSDLLKWDSPIAKLYGINATPTMILLNKDNKILKIGDKVEDFR